MKVYSLFNDYGFELVSLEFLQPPSNGASVEITYLSKVPDNIRSSVDRGVKEAYFLLSNKIKGVPDKIAVWCRGFEKTVHGNSADLAYAIELFSLMLRDGHIKADFIPSIVCATGVINNMGEITEVKGIREKLISAAGICKYNDKSIIIIPNANFETYSKLLENDEEFSSIMAITDAKVIPVAYLSDVIKVFNIKSKENSAKFSYLPVIFIASLIITVLALGFIYLKSKTNSNTFDIAEKNVPASNTIVQEPLNTSPQSAITPASVPTGSQNNVVVNDVNKMPEIITPQVKKQQPTIEADNKTIKTQEPTIEADNKTIKPNNQQKYNNNFTIIKTYPSAEQKDVYTNAPIIKIFFQESELKKGPSFDKISVQGDGIKVLNVELDQNLHAILINTLGKYNKRVTISIPEGALTDNSGKTNPSYSYSFIPTQDPRLSFESISDYNLNGWVKYTSDTGASSFSIGESASEVHSGLHSAKITSTAEKVSSYSYYFQNLKPNTNYRISGFIKTREVQGKSGAVLAVMTDNDTITSNPVTNNSNWRLVTVELNSASSKKLIVQCILQDSKGTAWFDDISIEEIP
ncbi:MAG: hypothetical protein Q8942_17710 [Bacillota bacterium]|nr:hypothetical protein [Bacillota bacterium]